MRRNYSIRRAARHKSAASLNWVNIPREFDDIDFQFSLREPFERFSKEFGIDCRNISQDIESFAEALLKIDEFADYGDELLELRDNVRRVCDDIEGVCLNVEGQIESYSRIYEG